MRRASRALLVLALAVAIPSGGAWGHALEVVSGESGAAAIVVAARYRDGGPASGARYFVFAPDASTAHQRGHADAAGRIAFVPDTSGAWRIVVEDDLGHRVETSVTVDLEGSASERWAFDASRGGMRPLVGLAAGLALIAALTGLAYVLRARRSGDREASDS